MAGIRFVDIKLDLENIDQGIKHILHELRPEWNYEDVVSKEFTEGYSNKILCYHQAEDEQMDDGIVVRLHLYDADSLAGSSLNRNNEVSNHFLENLW